MTKIENCYGVNELLLNIQRNNKSQPSASGTQNTFHIYSISFLINSGCQDDSLGIFVLSANVSE